MASAAVKVNTGNTLSGSPKNRLSDFGLDYQKLLNDNYVGDKLLTVKLTGTTNNFQLNAKGVLAYPSRKGEENSDAPEQLVATPEVKAVTNVAGRNLEVKVDTRGIRAWAGLGTYNVGRSVTLSAKVKATHQFANPTGWLAANVVAGNVDATVRVELKKNNEAFLNTRLQLTQGDLRTGLVAKVGLQGLAVRRNNLFVNWRNKDVNLFAEHVTGRDDQPLTLGTLVAAAIYNLNGNSLVLRATYQKSKNALDLVLGGVTKVNNNLEVRAKVNRDGVLAAAGKYTVNSNLAVTLGTELNLRDPASNLRKTRAWPLPLGAVVDLSLQQ